MMNTKFVSIFVAAVLLAGSLSISNAYAYLLDVQVSSGTTDDGRKTVTLFFAEPPVGEQAIDTDAVVDAVVDEVTNNDVEANVTTDLGSEPIVITNDETNDTTVVVVPVVEDSGNVTVIGTDEESGEVSVDVVDEGNVTVIGGEGEIGAGVGIEVNGTIDIVTPDIVSDEGNVTEAINATDDIIAIVDDAVEIAENATVVSNGNVTVSEEPTIIGGEETSGDNGTEVLIGDIPVIVEDGTDVTVIGDDEQPSTADESQLTCVTGTLDFDDGQKGFVQCVTS